MSTRVSRAIDRTVYHAWDSWGFVAPYWCEHCGPVSECPSSFCLDPDGTIHQGLCDDCGWLSVSTRPLGHFAFRTTNRYKIRNHHLTQAA